MNFLKNRRYLRFIPEAFNKPKENKPEIPNLQEEINKLKAENSNLQDQLKAEKKRAEELQDKNKQFETQMNDLRDKLTTEENEKIQAKNEEKTFKSEKEAELKEVEIKLQKMTADHKVSLDKIQSLQEEHKKLGYQDTPSSEDIDRFYDCVIDIPDLRSISSGWEIKMNPSYEKRKGNVGTIVSVVGNYSKGKTFLLELLSKKMFPHGFNVHTKGISVVYLGENAEADEYTPVIGLDTKGGSNPLNISSLITQGTLDEEFSAKLKETFRDHQATEDIIQNFILDQANVILVVVADLTFDDQQLVNKIRKKFAGVSRKKRVIVVHNLFHTQRSEDVKSKIDESILKSFALNTVRYTTTIEGKNCNYYEDSTCQDFAIPHVILAKQNSEAGNFYNETSVKFIQSCLESAGNQKSIDVVEALQAFLKEHIKQYIEVEEVNIQIRDNKMILPISLPMTPLSALSALPDEAKTSRQEIKMRPVSIDEFGFLKTLQGCFEPNYILSVSLNEGRPKKLHLLVECPGIEKGSVETGLNRDDQEYHIVIEGKINSEQMLANNQKPISNTTKQGLFRLKTDALNRAHYNIGDYPDECKIKDGFLQLVYEITEFAPMKKLTITDE